MPRRYGANRILETHLRPTPGQRLHHGSRSLVAMPNLDTRRNRLVRNDARDPVHLRNTGSSTVEILDIADDDLLFARIQAQHVESSIRRDAEPMALADGEMVDALMPPQDATRRIDDLAKNVTFFQKGALVLR